MTKLTGTTVIAAALIVVGGTTALAHQDHRDQRPRPVAQRGVPLLDLAVRVEGSARQVSHRAERSAHHGSPSERRALILLDRVEHESRQFRRSLQRFGRHDVRTARDYRQLVVAFDRARASLPGLHPTRQVRRAFQDLNRRVERLDDALTIRRARHGRTAGLSAGYGRTAYRHD